MSAGVDNLGKVVRFRMCGRELVARLLGDDWVFDRRGMSVESTVGCALRSAVPGERIVIESQCDLPSYVVELLDVVPVVEVA